MLIFWTTIFTISVYLSYLDLEGGSSSGLGGAGLGDTSDSQSEGSSEDSDSESENDDDNEVKNALSNNRWNMYLLNENYCKNTANNKFDSPAMT